MTPMAIVGSLMEHKYDICPHFGARKHFSGGGMLLMCTILCKLLLHSNGLTLSLSKGFVVYVCFPVLKLDCDIPVSHRMVGLLCGF